MLKYFVKSRTAHALGTKPDYRSKGENNYVKWYEEETASLSSQIFFLLVLVSFHGHAT